MKNITKILLALAALFILGGIMVSCSQEVTVDSTMVKTAEKTSPTTSPTTDAGKVVVYYITDAKVLTGSSVEYEVEDKKVEDADVTSITGLMDGKAVTGMSFENITEITGVFSGSVFTETLKDLQFDGALTSIGENCFKTSVNLENVDFTGETMPKIASTAFPAKDEYTTNCGFGVPVSLVEEARETLKDFIDDNGYLKVEVKIVLNTNEEYYKEKDDEFGTPELSKTEVGTYVGRSVSITTPTNPGYTFLGFYADEDTTATQVFDAEGALLSNVDGYTNEKGLWVRDSEETVLYAHWALDTVEVTYWMNNGTSENRIIDVKRGCEITLLTATELLFEWENHEITGWTTTSDSDTVVYEDGAKTSFTSDISLYAVWWRAPSYYEKGAAFLKEYVGWELPEWDEAIGSTDDNSASWTTETGMHFVLDSNINVDFAKNFKSMYLAEDLDYYYFDKDRRFNTYEHEEYYEEEIYTTSTWFAYDLPVDKQTDEYKKCRITVGTGMFDDAWNEKTKYYYISIDVSFIDSAIGTLGAVDGYIFYDVDEDNNEENEGAGPDGLKSDICGWKYLEAAPANSITTETCVWFNSEIDTSMTSQNIGSGEDNTSYILNAAQYFEGDYAAYNCRYSWIDNGDRLYDDYFLPSLRELEAIRKNLFLKNLGGFTADKYWSSSENNKFNALVFDFGSAQIESAEKTSQHKIRPVRMIREVRDN